MKKGLLIFYIFLTAHHHLSAQDEDNAALRRTILSFDSLLFNVGFNTCDVSQFENLLSEHFEFFHDRDGISQKTDFIRNLRNGLCGSPDTYQSRRELVEASTEIFPLYKQDKLYGAIQKGNHQFYETLSGQTERLAGSARFVSVWLLEGADWKLVKCLSFDHQAEGSDRK